MLLSYVITDKMVFEDKKKRLKMLHLHIKQA